VGWLSEAALLRIAAALLLPLLAVAVWTGIRGGAGDGALASVTVRIWGAALLLTLLAGCAVSARARRGAAALAWTAALAAGLSFAWAVGSRYVGVVELGEGEPPGAWTALSAGPLADLPVLEVAGLPRDASGPARLRMRGREVDVRLMEEVAVAGDHLRVTRVAPVFGFELRRQSGEVLDGLLVKLHPGEENEFGFERMPHRIMAPLAASAEVSAPVPDRLRLRVQRGKLLVADQPVAPGEPLRFEGLALTMGGGGRWARLEVRGGTTKGLWFAAGLALLACGAAWLERRRARA
jgi:hypothetical protein